MMSRSEFFTRVGRATGYTAGQLYAAYETYRTCPLSAFREERALLAVDCSRCGNCCRRPWRVEASLQDVLRWAVEGRHDILASLEHRPRKAAFEPYDVSPVIWQLAGQLAGEDEEATATTLAVAQGVEHSEGSYVLPRNGRCRYLIDGVTTACGIYDTRPEICRTFPDIQ